MDPNKSEEGVAIWMGGRRAVTNKWSINICMYTKSGTKVRGRINQQSLSKIIDWSAKELC